MLSLNILKPAVHIAEENKWAVSSYSRRNGTMVGLGGGGDHEGSC